MAKVFPLLLILCVLLSCEAPTPPIGPPPSPTAAFEGEVVESIASAIDAIEAAPTQAKLRRALGLLYLANGGPREAAEALNQAVTIDPADARAWFFLGMAQEKQGNLDAALAAMASARAQAPTHTPLWWRPGFWLLDVGQAEAALPLFQAAAALERPGQGPSADGAAHRIGRARCLLDMDRPAAAIPILEELRGLITHYYADFLLGQAYRRAGRADDADRLRVSAAAEPPSFPDPWMEALSASKRGLDGRLARIDELLEANRLREAGIALTEARARWKEDVNLLHRLGGLYSQQGNTTAWVRTLKQAARIDPDNAATQHNLSIALLRSGKLNDALTHAHLAVAANPNFVEAWVQMARLIIKQRGLDGPSSPDEAAAIHEALVPMDQASALGIERASDHLMYGHLLFRSGRLDDSQRVLRRLIERGDADPRAWAILSETWSARGEHRKALETAIDGINRFPNQPDLVRIVDQYRRATGGAPPQ